MTFTTVVLNPPLATLEVAVLGCRPATAAFRRIAGAALGKRLRELDRKDAKGTQRGSTGAKTPQSDGESPGLVTGRAPIDGCCRQS